MKQKTVGFVTPGYGGFYYGRLLQSVYDISREHGYRLIVIQNDRGFTYQTPLAANHIDGWITTEESVREEYIENLIEFGKPIVNISHSFNGCHSVQTYNRKGMFEAVEHLIGHGHRNIAFVTLAYNCDFQQRLEGYKDALAKYQIPFNPELVVTTNSFSPNAGSDACKILFDRGIPFTAVALSADYFAPTLFECLKEAGYRIPEDVAVMGFDNSLESATYNPPLSTVEHSVNELAIQAFHLLMRHIEHPGLPLETVYIGTKLIIRSSCGCQYENQDIEAGTNHFVIREKDLLSQISHASKTLCDNLSSFNATQNLSWLAPTPVKHACLALFTDDNPDLLKVKHFYPAGEENKFEKEIISTLNLFPHESIMSNYMKENEVLLLAAIQTETSVVGAMCCAGSLQDIAFTHRVAPFFQWIASSFENEKLSRQLDYVAHHDSLCGLPNRKLLIETLSGFIEKAREQDHQLAVILIDLDDFKKVNDLFGHYAGDELLIKVSRLLKDISGDNKVAARLGGDEFVILMPHVKDEIEAIELAKNIINTINIPFTNKDSTFYVTASVGISLFPKHGDDCGTLLKNSDTAMYRAKEKGKCNFSCFGYY